MQKDCYAFRATGPAFCVGEVGSRGGLEVREPRGQPRGVPGSGGLCQGEQSEPGVAGERGGQASWMEGDRAVAMAGSRVPPGERGRRKGPRPSRKLRPPPPWGPLAAQSGPGGRRRLVHPPNLATFAPLSQHDLVRSPFRRSPLGQGEVEGDDWKQRPGACASGPAGCLWRHQVLPVQRDRLDAWQTAGPGAAGSKNVSPFPASPPLPDEPRPDLARGRGPRVRSLPG